MALHVPPLVRDPRTFARVEVAIREQPVKHVSVNKYNIY